MKSIVFCSALGALIVASSDLSQASVTLQIISDNDFAVFVGDTTTVTRLIYQNNESWPDQITAAGSFSFDFEPGETTVYLLGMDGVDITTTNASQSSNLAGYLTGYTTSATEVESGAYVATLEDVSGAIPNLTWGSPSVIEGGVGSNVTGFAFQYPSDSASIFRFSAEAIGVPEPGVTMLALFSGMIFARRRGRPSA